MAGCGIVSLWAMTLTNGMQYLVLAVVAALYIAAIVLIERAGRKRGATHA